MLQAGRGFWQIHAVATKTASKKKPAVKSHSRAKDQTQISISLGKDLLEQIDECAEADARTRSNWIVQKLTAALDAELQGHRTGNGRTTRI